jgi:hypothetical protein
LKTKPQKLERATLSNDASPLQWELSRLSLLVDQVGWYGGHPRFS